VLDTTPVTAQITKLIATGTTEQALLTAVRHLFPDLSPAELSQALQVATTAAERQAARRPDTGFSPDVSSQSHPVCERNLIGETIARFASIAFLA
jgi:hypothetical protein